MNGRWRAPPQTRRFGLITLVGVSLAFVSAVVALPRAPTSSETSPSETQPGDEQTAPGGSSLRPLGFPVASSTQPTAAATAPGGRTPLPVIPTNAECASGIPAKDAVARADELLAGIYTLRPFPAFHIGLDPTWAEDPLGDRYWRFRFHSLRWVDVLFEAWGQTGNAAYRDRAAFLLKDWYEDDPPADPPSQGSWEDHATAWRGMIYGCAAHILPRTRWLTAALQLHGRVLADPDFYIRHGNHALNQDRGLLEVGCTLGRRDWMQLAARRMDVLIRESIDDQGATNEQAPYYALLNYDWYKAAEARLVACGQPLSAGFARLDAMPLFLAHATLPNGQYAMIGDTPRRRATPIPGSPAEYAATMGASGQPPGAVEAVYRAGFAFVRSGWGERRPFTDEIDASLRFGPARRFHGHDDAGSVTLYGYGDRLLLNGGGNTFKSAAEAGWAAYFVGRSAHDVVTVDDVRYRSTASRLVWQTSTAQVFGAAVEVPGYAGVSLRRTLYFVRELPYLVIDDVATSSHARSYRQLWHLMEDADPTTTSDLAVTHRIRGNVLIRQAVGGSTVESRIAPGWLSYEYGQHLPAPVVEFVAKGKTARFVTVIVPFADAQPQVSARLVHDGPDTLVEMTIDGRVDRLTLTGPDQGTLVSAP